VVIRIFLFIVILAILVIFYLTSKKLLAKKIKRENPSKFLVKCHKCGVSVSEEEIIFKNNNPYCCNEHANDRE